MENPNLEQRSQRIESLLKPQKNAFTLDIKRKRKAKRFGKILIIFIEKIIEQFLPYAIPFIIHFWDNLCNLL